ncbi:MAG: hypothetical protein IJ532_08310 [Alphaproteobacteria bacterium]|nr:hypothetical protein [Alphaproteobacteria bacterium]
MKQYFKYVLPFFPVLFLFGGIACAFALEHCRMLTKAEFYAKHHIENNTIMSSSFDEEKCRRAFTEIYRERYKDNAKLVQYEVEEFIALLKRELIPPEQYEGFYPPQPKVKFYNALYKDNLLKLGLSPQDIKDLDLIVTDEMVQEWHMHMTIQQLEKEGFYSIADTAQLAAKVGDNIYLTVFYTDCGTSGCYVYIMVKEKGKWYSKKSDILIDSCVADEHKEVYECDLEGGHNDLWHYVADYAPLKELSDKYYEVWGDYVRQYIQKRK